MRTLILIALIAIAPASYAQRASHTGTQSVVVAQVLHVQPVHIEQRRTNTGNNLGRQIGHRAGREAGGNAGLSQIAGTIGGMLGEGAQGQFGSRGVEIFVRDERGRTRSVVQYGHSAVVPGDTVAIVGSGRNTRVVPIGQR